MAATLQFFDMSMSLAPPQGHLEPVPVTLGPNWQPGDLRIMFVSALATATAGFETEKDITMAPDPPTGFTASYSREPGWGTHGVYFRRLVAGDNSSGVTWPKPAGWRAYMLALMTVRNASPTTNPTAGNLRVTALSGDTTATATSVTVPGAGAMVFCAGSVPSPEKSPWPNWGVSMGAPTGWVNLVASEGSGADFYQFKTDAAGLLVGKTFASSGSTGAVSVPTAEGRPAFTGLYAFITPAADVSASIGAV